MVELEHDERLRLLRHILGQSIVEEERLYQRCVELRAARERWQRRAGLAWRKGHQDLARQAVEQGARCDRLAEAHRAEFEAQRRHVQELKRRLRQAEIRPPGLAAKRGMQDVELALLALDYDPVVERLAKLEREERLESQLADLKVRLAKQEAS